METSRVYLQYPPAKAVYTWGCTSRYFPTVVKSEDEQQHDINYRYYQQSGRAKSDKYPVFTPISHLPRVGDYAKDSYRMFCVGGDEWKRVQPTDKELVRVMVRLNIVDNNVTARY